jgi:hypothetical protein
MIYRLFRLGRIANGSWLGSHSRPRKAPASKIMDNNLNQKFQPASGIGNKQEI